MKILIAPMLAMLFYGGWAAYSNNEYGLPAMFMAGLVQGAFAFTSTLLLALTVTALMTRKEQKSAAKGLDGKQVIPEVPLFQSVVVFIQTSSLLAGIPYLLHWWAGTQDVLQAMLPGLVVGNAYLVALIRQHGR